MTTILTIVSVIFGCAVLSISALLLYTGVAGGIAIGSLLLYELTHEDKNNAD